MSVSAVQSKTATANDASTTTDSYTNPSSTLNQTNFLQLLVAQIQYQDPMNPQSNTDMAAQLAQFTSLQQATESSSSLAMMQATSLVGTTVTLQVDATHTASGEVTGVIMNKGVPQITVGGKNYNLNQVTSVSPTTVTSNTAVNNSAAASTTSNNAQNK